MNCHWPFVRVTSTKWLSTCHAVVSRAIRNSSQVVILISDGIRSRERGSSTSCDSVSGSMVCQAVQIMSICCSVQFKWTSTFLRMILRPRVVCSSKTIVSILTVYMGFRFRRAVLNLQFFHKSCDF